VDPPPGYREIPPPPALRNTVECLWTRAGDTGGELRIVPDACSDVVWQRGRGTSVVGPDTSAKLVPCAPDDVFVGIRFLPGAGGGALGVPLNELRDQRVDATEVDRTFDIHADAEPAEVIKRLVSAAAGREADPLVARAARVTGRHGVDLLARELGLSERQLRRRFHAAVGYGPKALARVLRFRRFIRAVELGRTDLAQLAFDLGYADQAHLTRESTRLAGLPPLALIRSWNNGSAL
jgi:AraC-like DNA-binding protein